MHDWFSRIQRRWMTNGDCFQISIFTTNYHLVDVRSTSILTRFLNKPLLETLTPQGTMISGGSTEAKHSNRKQLEERQKSRKKMTRENNRRSGQSKSEEEGSEMRWAKYRYAGREQGQRRWWTTRCMRKATFSHRSRRRCRYHLVHKCVYLSVSSSSSCIVLCV